VANQVTNTGTIFVARGGELKIKGGFLQTAGTTTLKSGPIINGVPTNQGTLEVQRAFFLGGTLQGTGKVKGAVTVAGGVLKPGDAPGILTITNGVEMLRGGVFSEEIDRGASGPVACDGAGCYSQLDVTGGTTLSDAILKIKLDTAPLVGDLFGIIDNLDAVPVSGNFLGLPQDSTFAVDSRGTAYDFTISYDGNIVSPSLVTFNGGNDVVLQLVGKTPAPEPPSLALLLLPVAFVSWCRYRGPIRDITVTPAARLSRTTGVLFLSGGKLGLRSDGYKDRPCVANTRMKHQ
jgi:hypothetical protein